MTQRQTTRSQMLRRIGVALAATIAVSTVATTGSQAAKHVSKYGGKVKVAIFDTFPGFCFGDNNANSALMVQRTIYEGLFEKTIGGDMVGLLAESGSSSADLKVWNIKLRPNIKFSDGAVFDAAAVKLNLDYASGKNSHDVAVAGAGAIVVTATFQSLLGQMKTGGAFAAVTPALPGLTAATVVAGQGTLAFYAALGTFAKGGAIDLATGGNLDKFGLTIPAWPAWAASTYQLSTATAFLGNFAKIEVVDSLNVRITLVRGQNDLPNTLYASGRFFMRSPAQFINGKTICSEKPIGTGPFKVADDYKLTSTDEVIVYKNPTYWRTDPVTKAKLPYLDQITFTNVKEASQRSAALRTGKYDAGMFAGGSEARYVQDLRNKRKALMTEFRSPNEFYPSLWLNQGKTGSPFANKDARMAVLSCLDRENFVKVRTKGESVVAKSLVGPTSIMYTTRGFQKYDPVASKAFADAYKVAAGKDLEFTFPADVSTLSQANAAFFVSTWAACGIKANIVVEEAAQIISKTFNSAGSGAAQNAYDAIFILLLEGTDVSFNMPFLLSNSMETTGQGATFRGALGSLLSLNKYVTIPAKAATATSLATAAASAAAVSDAAMKAGQASNDKNVAKLKYQEAIAFLQTEGFMGSVAHGSYSFFATKKSGLVPSIGKLKLVKGKTQRIVTNWGIDWTGVYKSK